jgi:hypothetical protein
LEEELVLFFYDVATLYFETGRQEILCQPGFSKVYHEYRRKNGERLIHGYSSAIASKDAHNREKGIERLRKSYHSDVLKKEHINKQGYNKFLTLKNEVTVVLDQSKIDADKLWDRLKGYITNTELPASEVIDQYHGLWVREACNLVKHRYECRQSHNRGQDDYHHTNQYAIKQ